MEGQILKGIIDTQKQTSKNLGTIQLNDTLTLDLEIRENEESFDISDSSFLFLAKKHDGNLISQDINITVLNANEGHIKIKLDKQCVTHEGLVACQLCITDKDYRISTCKFYYIVNGTIEGDAIESIRKFSTLDDLEKWLIESNKELEKFKSYIETLTNNNIQLSSLLEIKDFVKDNLGDLTKENNLSKENIKDLKELNSNVGSNLSKLDSSNETTATNIKMLDKLNTDSKPILSNLEATIESANKFKEDLKTTIESADYKKNNLNISISEAKNCKDILEKYNSESNAIIPILSEKYNLADSKNKELSKSLQESKKYIDALAPDKNIPELKKEFNDLKENLSNSKYLDYEGTNITCKNSLAGIVNNLIIEGNTIKKCGKLISVGENKNNLVLKSCDANNSKQSSITIIIPETLKRIKEIKDIINCPQKIYNKKISEKILNGTEEWIYSADNKLGYLNKTIHFQIQLEEGKGYYGESDKFDFKTVWCCDEEGIYLASNKNLAISIYKNKLDTQDVKGFKKWLNLNNVTFYYVLEHPQVKELSAETINQLKSLKTFNGVTRITTEDEVQATLKLSVANNLSATRKDSLDRLNCLEDRVLNLEKASLTMSLNILDNKNKLEKILKEKK